MAYYNEKDWEDMPVTEKDGDEWEDMSLDEDVSGGMAPRTHEPVEAAPRTFEPTEAPLYEEATVLGRAGDVGVDVARGVIGLGESFVGLAKMEPTGLLRKGFDAIGYDAGLTDEFLSDLYSDERKVEEAEVEDATGVVGTIKTLIKNPAAMAGQAVQMAPGMLSIMGAARVALARSSASAIAAAAAKGITDPKVLAAIGRKAGAKVATITAAAAEGIQQTGTSFNKLIEDAESMGKAYVASILSGVGTAGFAFAGGKLGQKLGLGDVEAGLAGEGGIAGRVGRAVGGKLGIADSKIAGRGARMVGGGIQEGLLEETPQSMQEQAWQNYATGRPLLEGVPEAGATGFVLGSVMGGGMSTASRPTKSPTDETDLLNTGMTTREEKQREKFMDDLLAGMESGEITPERMQAMREAMPEGPLTDILDGFLTQPQAPPGPYAGEELVPFTGTPSGEPITLTDPEIIPPKETPPLELPLGQGFEIVGDKPRGLDLVPSTTIQLPHETEWEEIPIEPAAAPLEKTDVALEGEAAAVDVEAHEAATSPLNDLSEPTQAQKEAGNYKKAHIKVQGMDITIENPEGSERTGVSPEGEKWSTLMKAHYGYFKRTEGKDGDQIDAFINPEQRTKKDNVYIVDQVNPETGKFDEHKVMVGYADIGAAEQAYLANYEEGWKGLGNISEVPMADFKNWLKKGKQTKPYALPSATGAIEPEALPITPAPEEVAETTPLAEPGTIKTRPPDAEGRRKAERRKWETREEFEKLLGETEDVEEAKKLARQATEKSYIDPLMGISNKAAWIEHKAKEDELPPEQRQFKSVLDIDNFSWVNDVLGHDLGDSVLKQVGTILSEESGRPFRFGGEEFLIEGEDLEGLTLQSEKIRGRLESEIVLEHVLGQDVTLEDGTKYKAGEKITVEGIGLSYGIDKDFKKADEALIADKGRRTEAGIRSPKGREIQRLRRELPGRGVEEGKDIRAAEKVTPKEKVREEKPREEPTAEKIVQPPASERVEKKAVGKESWEMTSEEWLGSKFDKYPAVKAGNIIAHKKTVQKALSEGKPVPELVLKDYPDLQKKVSAKPDIEITGKKDKKDKQYTTKTTFKDSNISLEDVKSIFKGQRVSKSPDGTIFIRTALGRGVQIKSAETITPDETAFNVGYSRMKASGELVAGKYQDGVITISKVGDKHTLSHESEHWMEDVGLINGNDQKALRFEIKRRAKKGKWKTLNKDDIGGKEDRAEFIAQELKQRTESRSTVQRIIQKIQDLIDSFVNLYKRTARGVVKDVRSGKIYDKKQKALREGMPRFMVAGKKAIGAPTGTLNKAQKMLAEGKSKDEAWKKTGWLKGAEGSWKFEINDGKAELKNIKVDSQGIAEKHTYLGDILEHPELFSNYPELSNTITIIMIDGEMKNPRGSYTSRVEREHEGLVDIEPEIKVYAKNIDGAKTTLLHEIQHHIQIVEGFAEGGTPRSVAESDIITTTSERIKLKEYKDRMDALFFEGKDWDSPEVTAVRSKREEYTKAVAEKKFGKDYGFEMYQRLAGEIEARDTAARAELTPAQRGLNFNKARTLWEQSQKIRKSDEYQLEEKEWLASGMKEVDLKKRNESSSHKKAYAIEDKIIGMGYNLNQKLVKEALAGGEVAQELLIQPLYESQGIPESEWIIKKGEGTSFSVKEGKGSGQVLWRSEDSQAGTYKLGKGMYFSKDRSKAVLYGKPKAYINAYPKNPLILKYNELIEDWLLDKSEEPSMRQFNKKHDITEFIKSYGYDGVVDDTNQEVVNFDPQNVKSFSTKKEAYEQYSTKPPKDDDFVSKFLKKYGVDVPKESQEARATSMVGDLADKTKAGTFQETLEPISEEDYISNRKANRNIKVKAATNIKRVASEVVEIVDKYLGSISTRLGQASPKLKAKLRKLDFDISTKSMDSVKAVEPLLRKAKKMTREDFADWDYARKNSDTEKIDELINKYGMQKEYTAYRKVLDGLRKEGLDVGLEIGKINEYAPRILKDARGFLTAIGKAEEWPIYSRRLQEKARELGITEAEMTSDMKADMISNMILGGWTGLGGIPATKQRKLQKIPAYLNKYYLDSDAALMQHIHSIRKNIEARKFFGKIPQKVGEMRKRLHNAQAKTRELKSNLSGNLTKNQHKLLERLKKLAASGKLKDKKLAAINSRIKAFENIRTNTMPDEQTERIRKRRNKYIGLEKEYTAYIGKYALQRDYTENIGSYIVELISNKEITPKHEQVVNDILKARFHEVGTHGVVQAYKNLSYIDTMGSPISALTQIGDLAWAAYEGGLIRALKYAAKSAVGKSRITRKDVGVERIAQEFADSGMLGNAVTKVFKIVGLEKIDAIGKEALLNTALDKYQKQAKSDPLKLKRQIEPIFEGETDSVIDDLVNDEISENIKLLVYSRLLDFQPVGLSEMPQGYLTAGNWRLFYMLKTFTIKVFDVYRNEVYNKIKKGSNVEKIEGLKNLARLSFFFVLANAGADELKDWVLGRKTELSDRLVDNMLRLFGISKFVTWKARTEGVGSALSRQILPPFKFVDSLGKDIITAGDEKGLEVVGSIPVVGKLAYWHVGRGVSKRGDLWDRRWRKRKAKLNKVQDSLEKSKDKRTFKREHRGELIELRQINQLQGRLNSYRKRINRLKSREETVTRKKRIQSLESKRTSLIKEFLGRKKTQNRLNDFTQEYISIRNTGKSLVVLRKSVAEFNRKQTAAGKRTISWSSIVKKGNRIRKAQK